MKAAVNSDFPSNMLSVMGCQSTAEISTTRATSPATTRASARATGRMSSPRSRRAAISREPVCSTARKSTTAVRKVAAQSSATGP